MGDVAGRSVLSVVGTVALWVVGVVVGLLVLIIVASLIVPPLTRSFTDRWGATKAETAEKAPGDDLFPATREISTKAVTINAPPDLVYSLLVQMGQHRGGWYGWDWFYNLTGSSDFVDGHYSKRVVPELQDVNVGDKISINDAVQYDVVRADRPRDFVLVAGSIPASDLPLASMPETWTENSLAFVVKPLPGQKSRLILRMRADSTDTGFARWIWNGPLNFGSALFSRKTIVGLKRVAEQLAAQSRIGGLGDRLERERGQRSPPARAPRGAPGDRRDEGTRLRCVHRVARARARGGDRVLEGNGGGGRRARARPGGARDRTRRPAASDRRPPGDPPTRFHCAGRALRRRARSRVQSGAR